jgi:protein-S-isoprenylcysteine O-methyltransferase Ste14
VRGPPSNRQRTAEIEQSLVHDLVGLAWPSPLDLLAYVIGAALVAAGVGMLAAAGGALAQVSAVTRFPAPRTGSGLQTSGIYRLVRHPMYCGGILITLGWSTIFATVAGLALTIVFAVFADFKARREELWLEQTFCRVHRVPPPHS